MSLASLSDQAIHAVVTKAAIYHYFPNEKEIYEGIIVRTLKGLLRDVSAATGAAKDPNDAISRFMSAHADYFEQHYNGFLTMPIGYGGMENVVMLKEAQQSRDDYESLLRRIVADGILAGAFMDVDVQITSQAILSMLNWMVRWFKPGKGRRASEFAQEYCTLILSGIRP